MRLSTTLHASLLLACAACTLFLASPADRDPGDWAEIEASNGEAAARWWRLHFQDENGHIPIEGQWRALEHRKRMLDAQALMPEDAGVQRASWTWLGPKNYSGRIRSLVVHPTKPDHLLVGSASGGIWKSTDGGKTWRPIDDFMGSLSFRTLVNKPGAPGIVYAGSGEIQPGIGILRSTDFGDSWQPLPGSPALGDVYKLAAAHDGSALYAASVFGIYRIYDDQPPVRLATDPAFDIDVAPGQPQRLTATVRRSAGARALYSSDGGQTWNAASGIPAAGYIDRIETTFAPSNANVVYALSGEGGGILYKSADGGAGYSVVFSGPTQTVSGRDFFLVNGQVAHNIALWVNPTDANSLFAGGVSLWKSTTGGTSWLNQGCPICFIYNPTTNTYTNLASGGPVDFHQVVSDPGFGTGTNRSVYMVFDQGVIRSPDISKPDVDVLIPTLGTMQLYGGAVDVVRGKILAGGQDTGVHLIDVAGGDSRIQSAGDGGPAAFDPRDATQYQTTQFLDIDRRSADGSSFVSLTRCDQAEPFRLSDSCSNTTNFIAPFVMDDKNPDRLYGGGLRLWRADNAKDVVTPGTGVRWTNLGLPGATSGNYVSAIAIDPNDFNVVWVARNSGDLYVTANATAPSPAWLTVPRGSRPGRMITSITISPHNSQLVYLTLSAFAVGNIWRTNDRGGTWQQVTGDSVSGLPPAPVFDLAIHPASIDGRWIYAATNVGLFTSENGGFSWSVTNDGPANVIVHDLFWYHNDLILATHGRGLWRAAVPHPTPLGAPGAPVKLAATLNGRSLLLSWGAGRGGIPTRYSIEFGGAPGATNFGVFPSANATPGFMVPNVPDITAYARVRAVNDAGVSAPSNEVLIRVGCFVPDPPTAFVASASGNTVAMTWAASTTSGVTYVLHAGSTRGSSNIAQLAVATATSYSATAPPGVYFLRVEARQPCGVASVSNEVELAVALPTPPPAPTGLTSSVAAQTVSLTWQAPLGALTGFSIEAGSAPGLANLAVVAVGNTVRYERAGVPRGTYFVRVRAVNGSVTGTASNEVTVTVP